MSRRPYTAKDKEFVLRHYGRFAPEPLATSLIARALGRTSGQIRTAAWKWGRSWQTRPHVASGRLMRHYRKGLSDGAIGLLCDCSTLTVWRWRRRNGLPANVGSWGNQKRKVVMA